MVVRTLFALAALALIAATPPNCTGCDFSHANLQGKDFSNVRYVGTDFSGANLRDTNFTDAKLTGVDFSGADLHGARFTHLSCTGCDLGGVDLGGFDLSNVQLVGADLHHVRANGTRFTNAQLIGVDFHDADLTNANLHGAAVCWHNSRSYDGVEEQTELQCIDLRGATVTGADFSGTRLCDRHHGTEACSPVDAAMLREYSHSDLAGAKLP
jgi:uncharacterized protein YjbI with pentapeptide repeats